MSEESDRLVDASCDKSKSLTSRTSRTRADGTGGRTSRAAGRTRRATRPRSLRSRTSRTQAPSSASGMAPSRGVGLNCVRSARTPDRGRRPGANTYIYVGFVNRICRARYLARRPVTARVSPVSPSLNKEGNAACASLACRKVTTRETRVQRRISTWYQNLWVL